uniref:RING finger and transmembrane domain-containing protein 2 isoform X2 n=1 Tax=Rhizophora mucronata TaxID=61149 RepID=A0A2P2LP08_RHIMU
MEASSSNSDRDIYRGSSGGNSSNFISRRYGMLSPSAFIQAPISTLLEYSGLLRATRSSTHQDMESLINEAGPISPLTTNHRLDDPTSTAMPTNNGEVAIRIIGAGEHDHDMNASGMVFGAQNEVSSQPPIATLASDDQLESGTDRSSVDAIPQQPSNSNGDGETMDGTGSNARNSSYQRYDIQQAARWIEQVLPFSLLLLVVFIRQHLQGFFVAIWIAVVMFKSNDILRKQTALKGERKMSVVIGISLAFMLHVVGVYWWYQNDDLLYPLIMLPPKSIPPFWHAIFIILVNGMILFANWLL